MTVDTTTRPVRVLYSYPQKLGAGRICYIAWQQVNGLAAAGAQVLAYPGVLHRPVSSSVVVHPTLALGRLRVSYKLLGTGRALALHDFIVARRLRQLSGQVDIVHAWPSAALRTLKTAAQMGIPTVLERPSAYTRFVYEIIRREYERLHIPMSRSEEYRPREDRLRLEEEEFRLADYLLCPSDYVVQTFRDAGFPEQKLLRHQYGFDEKVCFPEEGVTSGDRGLTVLFVGVSAPIKGLHYALQAWMSSPAHHTGTFLIAGTFTREYAEGLSKLASHPSIKVLGWRDDVPELMRKSDILVLPSLSEGYALVVAEAIGSGCVPLASDACTEICRHMKNGLVHCAGDVHTLTEQITLLHQDRMLLGRLRATGLGTAHENTWTVAGVKLLQVYQKAIDAYSQGVMRTPKMLESQRTLQSGT